MILCCGEALIDLIPTPTVEGGEGFVPHVGGAVFNTAIALGRLDVPVGLMTPLSDDFFGETLHAALGDNQVSRACVARVDRPSTLAFVHLDAGQARYSFFDENSAGRLFARSEVPLVPAEVNALYFGGISLACAPGADTYAAVLAAERKGRVVMIDPNIRPAFIADEPAFRARLADMFTRADIIKVSDEDLDWLLPENATLEDKARAVLEGAPQLVIVTRGAKGATAYGADGGAVSVTAPRAQVVDTVGAGDTFNAGVLAHLDRAGVLNPEAIETLDPQILEAALAFGARVAGVTVSRAGANPPWSRELAARD